MRFIKDQKGASAAEYALLLAIIAAGIAIAAANLGTAITEALDDAADCIEQGPDCTVYDDPDETVQ